MNSLYCVHDNFPSSCQKCRESKFNQYCRLCSNACANHTEQTCPYKTHAAISSALRPRACRALGCMDCRPGQTHYCDICRDNDANHRSLNCPLKTSVYCIQGSQPQITYVRKSPSLVVIDPSPAHVLINPSPVVVVRERHPQPIFVGVNTNPVIGFSTSNGVFYFG